MGRNTIPSTIDRIRIPLLDEATETPALIADKKPSWRGWLHAGAFPIAIASGIVLVVLADGTLAKWASAVFALTSVLLFGVSALYHRFNWKPRTKIALKRIDHSNIFLLIAGTYTPLALLALPKGTGIILLIAVWSGALLGIGFRVFWVSAPRFLYVAIYLALSWAAIAFTGELFNANPVMMLLVLIGGALYSGGAVVYALKRPNPIPNTIGFHEIFHFTTVLAFLCHWTAVLLIALKPLSS